MNDRVDFIIRELVSAYEFDRLDDLYQQCFGASSVPTDIQKDWWLHYRRGIIGVFLHEQLIGGLSYWPINEQTYFRLGEGILREREIASSDFDLSCPTYIYISEIAIMKDFRGKHYADLLLESFFVSVNEYVEQRKLLTLCAFAYSAAGASILTKYGFKKIADAQHTPDQLDFYVLRLGRS